MELFNDVNINPEGVLNVLHSLVPELLGNPVEQIVELRFSAGCRLVVGVSRSGVGGVWVRGLFIRGSGERRTSRQREEGIVFAGG